jgi:hypothetical protein
MRCEREASSLSVRLAQLVDIGSEFYSPMQRYLRCRRGGSGIISGIGHDCCLCCYQGLPSIFPLTRYPIDASWLRHMLEEQNSEV